jgi:hypothetical protein
MTEHGDGIERTRQLMMAALDDEITRAEREELERRLADDPDLRNEWNGMIRVKEVTRDMVYRSPPAEVWTRYWASVYSRIERGVGWVLISIGAIVLLSYGIWKAVEDVLSDSALPGVIRGAILTLLVGFVILVVSVVREKWFVNRSDPYKDVNQ